MGLASMRRGFAVPGLLSLLLSLPIASGAVAQVTPFKQAVAEAAAEDSDIAGFYRENEYAPLWTGTGDGDRARRAELLRAIENAEAHGLPVARYDPAGLVAQLGAVRSERDRGLAEVAMSRVFLQYARDIQTGVLIPSRIDRQIVREIPYRDRGAYLASLNTTAPAALFRGLPPRTIEYNALLKEKLTLERLLAAGGWGPTVQSGTLRPGDTGKEVLSLRNRLISMGFLDRTLTQSYDETMTTAVKSFQLAHGLNQDGIAGPETMRQINSGVETRLQSVIVALERERWLNLDRGDRHVLVNIPDFSARIIDNGKVTFSTRSVVGAARDDRPTPEFSDRMEFMVINPSWYVPRSIVTKEYLPQLKRNPYAVRHIEVTDRQGRKINRGAVNFNNYNARNFPFSMRQPPSHDNALGLVKFMFPNKYNIYLHDTPAKSLFQRDVRAFSHGCVRLADPFEFAYALLAPQSDDPEGLFHAKLNTGRETRVNLEPPVPVHLIYRTAFTNARGQTEYRADIYGRDARIWSALSKAGVALRAYRG
ncbi:murein L,D-transpeptidase [Sulfitobacter aestuarii]|uniref:Murein L,D-transpeptidase n=1 Tax=Sulfitobacter aestuarii TaxID=2161676 RepID=A0ABW5U1A7_9RHOB